MKRLSGSVRLRRVVISGDYCFAIELKSAESKKWVLHSFSSLRRDKKNGLCVSVELVNQLIHCIDLGYKHVICFRENEW